MENKMDTQHIVEAYLEDFFGHDLLETLTPEELAEAIIVVNKLAYAVNDHFGLYENKKDKDRDEPESALGILAPDEHVKALNLANAIRTMQDTAFKRKSGPPQTR